MFSEIYRTGDYASLHKGLIYFEGRKDLQIKIRGHRVDLSEIEKSLMTLNYVDEGIVICYHANEIDQALLAFCVLNACDEGKGKTGNQIEKSLEKMLIHYMVPQVVVLDEFPYLVNGKVDRQQLLSMYENMSNNDDAEIEESKDLLEKTKKKILFKAVATSVGRSIRKSMLGRSLEDH